MGRLANGRGSGEVVGTIVRWSSVGVAFGCESAMGESALVGAICAWLAFGATVVGGRLVMWDVGTMLLVGEVVVGRVGSVSESGEWSSRNTSSMLAWSD